jgi:hypothetical protein
MAADFSAGIVSNEQNVRVGGIRWRATELVAPHADFSSAPQLPRHEAYGDRIAAGTVKVELVIDEPNFPERKEGKESGLTDQTAVFGFEKHRSGSRKKAFD